MSDYSAVAPPQNFSQSSAFAAALQRAKQVIVYVLFNYCFHVGSIIQMETQASAGFAAMLLQYILVLLVIIVILCVTVYVNVYICLQVVYIACL